MRRTWTLNDFVINKKIGGGQYSKVYLAQEVVNKKRVALKVISNETIEKKLSESQFVKEIQIHRQLRHANILKLFGVFDDTRAKYIVLEYCEKGEMYKDIRFCHGYTNERAATYIYQLAHALDYCFDSGVIHRDIKSENILISASGAVKLADFGWSTMFLNENRQTFCGTLFYISPEMINGKPQNEKVDIWCLGILLYEMMTMETPFQGLDDNQFYANIKSMKYDIPDKTHLFAKFLIRNILRHNVYERLTARQIIRHPYVEQFAEKSLTECNAAAVQWKIVANESRVLDGTWSIAVDCPSVDFAKEAPNDIDVDFYGDGNDGSYSLMREMAKKAAAME